MLFFFVKIYNYFDGCRKGDNYVALISTNQIIYSIKVFTLFVRLKLKLSEKVYVTR